MLVNAVQTVEQWKQIPPQLASSTKEEKHNAINSYTSSKILFFITFSRRDNDNYYSEHLLP